jgi:hypothetical protein
MQTGTIDPKAVICSFGEITFSGFVDGDFFEADNAEDTWETVVGADGETVRVRKNNEVVEVKVSVLQTSQSNVLLQTAFDIDKSSGAFRKPFFMKDTLNATSVQGQGAYIKRQPGVKRGTGAATVEWTFVLPVGITKVGSAVLA